MYDADSHPNSMCPPREDPAIARRGNLASYGENGLVLVTFRREHVKLSANSKTLYSWAEASLSQEVPFISRSVHNNVCTYLHL